MPTATVSQGRPTRAPARRAGSLLLVLIAVCTAVTAANIYLAAPLLPLIARDYGSTPSAVAWVASVAMRSMRAPAMPWRANSATAASKIRARVASGSLAAAMGPG